VGVARIEKPQNSKFAILTPCARVQAYLTSDIHFIISKTVSAVRADAAEVSAHAQDKIL